MSEACKVCFRHCKPREGELGICLARRMVDGRVIDDNYGKLTFLQLDPIEKKPLRDFYPGSKILSVGSYGCNLFCPFCHQSNISTAGPGDVFTHNYTPEELRDLAISMKPQGNIGVAYTYNEPMVSYEFVRDTARLVHEAGMKNVLVTNGTAEVEVLEELLPYIDAMNVDFKGFDYSYYHKTLGGDIKIVIKFIERAIRDCHVEVTTLVVPQENDSEMTIRMISSWLANLNETYGTDIPLHICRFFPAYKMIDKYPTNPDVIQHLADVAGEKLDHVYVSNSLR